MRTDLYLSVRGYLASTFHSQIEPNRRTRTIKVQYWSCYAGTSHVILGRWQSTYSVVDGWRCAVTETLQHLSNELPLHLFHERHFDISQSQGADIVHAGSMKHMQILSIHYCYPITQSWFIKKKKQKKNHTQHETIAEEEVTTGDVSSSSGTSVWRDAQLFTAADLSSLQWSRSLNLVLKPPQLSGGMKRKVFNFHCFQEHFVFSRTHVSKIERSSFADICKH